MKPILEAPELVLLDLKIDHMEVITDAAGGTVRMDVEGHNFEIKLGKGSASVIEIIESSQNVLKTVALDEDEFDDSIFEKNKARIVGEACTKVLFDHLVASGFVKLEGDVEKISLSEQDICYASKVVVSRFIDDPMINRYKK